MTLVSSLQARWLRWTLLAASAVVVLLSLGVAIYPEPEARPMVPAKGLAIDSGFAKADLPRDYELRESIRKSPELAIWRTWSPATGSVRGDAHSIPFRMPKYLAVPYTGFAGNKDIWMAIECIGSGDRLQVATGRTNTQWSEAIVVRPKEWCEGNARLLVHNGSRSQYIGFGTPFRITTVSYVKTRFFGLLAPFLILFAAVAGLCVALAVALGKVWPRIDPLVPGLIGLGLTGYAMFFVFYAWQSAGQKLSYALVFVAGLGAWKLLRALSAPPAPAQQRDAETLRAPLIGWVAVSFSYFVLLLCADNGAGAWLANSRFTPVRWSTDNQLPMLVGEYLSRFDLAKLDLGVWQVSDRTPLSYGLHAWLRTPMGWITHGNDGAYLAPLIHTLIGIILNTAWVPVAVRIFQRLTLSPRLTGIAIATLAMLPFCLFNSIYIWPKLLGGAFGLLALWVLIEPDDERHETNPARRWTLAAILSALALLSHGGTVFGIVAMLAMAWLYLPRPAVRSLVAPAAIGAALLLPWMLWQRFVQPHGTALLKSVFAGTFGFHERNMGVVETILRSYRSITPWHWLAMKAEGLASLLLPARAATCGVNEMASPATGMGWWRIVDFISLAPSLKFLWLGLLVLLVPAARTAKPSAYRPAALLLGAGLLGVAIDELVAWDCQIIHTQSYQSILAIAVGLILLSLKCGKPPLGLAVTTLTLAYAMVVWVCAPLLGMPRLDPLAISVYFLFFIACMVALIRMEPGAGNVDAGP